MQRALLAFAPVVIAAALGNAATIPSLPVWYAGLAKPPLNPPNWIFGPVWTAPSKARRWAILAFAGQLALNMCWSFAFFGAQNPKLGLVVVVAMEAAIIATVFLFGRLDKTAARLLWPYAAWVGFASYLNAGIWWLN